MFPSKRRGLFEVKGQYPNYELFSGRYPFEGNVRIEALTSSLAYSTFEVEALDIKTSESLVVNPFGHFRSEQTEIIRLVLPWKLDWFSFINKIEVNKGHSERRGVFTILFKFDNPALWRGVHSFQEYVEELTRVIQSEKSEHRRADVSAEGVAFRDCMSTLERDILTLSEHLNEWHDRVIIRLFARQPGNSLVTSFEFPEEIRTYCEQYLVYFVQFLRDVGVEATSEIKHVSERVLFSVTPTNKDDALDKIRAALEVYLKLPFSPVTDEMTNEIAVQRLESSVHRLKSDLKLAAAELQAKNMTIEAQQLMIKFQKGLLHGELSIPEKDITPKLRADDREELFGGIAALTVYKKGGAELNLAKIFRHFKNLFKNEDEQKPSD